MLTTPESDPLSRPLRLPSGAVLRNRFVKAAMSEGLADRDTGAPTERLIRLYERWGRGGAGMLLTGNVLVDLHAREMVGNVVVHDERHLAQLRRWAEAAQANGAALWMQINHAGRQTPKRVTREPLAPSAVGLEGLGAFFQTPRELTPAEIEVIVGQFATTAAVARAAGFAGVQIHGAHGYLISQFLSPRTNTRDDDWGGDPERRSRFLFEIYRAMRRAVGDDYPIGVKLNSADFQRGGFTEEESMAIVRRLGDEGVDLIEVSGGNYESPAMFASGELAPPERASTRAREAFFADYAEKVRAVSAAPILLTGGLRTAAAMRDVVRSGAADAVGLARPMAVEPDLPARILTGDSDGAAPRKVRVGIALFDTMIQGAWYQGQMRRMAAGKEPKPGASRWAAVFSGFARAYAFNPLRLRRRRPALVAAPETGQASSA